MTTQSPDKSLSQSQTETMNKQKHYVWMCNHTAGRDSLLSEHSDEIEARAEMMRLWSQDLDVWMIFPDGTKELPNGKQISREVQLKEREAPLHQSPAASKEMEKRIQAIVTKRFTDTTKTHRETIEWACRDLAAEIGKEREAEVATLRAELADRWRDITANEQQTQRLLNDIENLRAEIAELKARP